MSSEITTAFSKQYGAAVELLVQQKTSRLRGAVRNERQRGEKALYDQVGVTTARLRTVRHGDSPYIETPHARRGVIMQDYDWGDFVDDQDKVRTLIDPTNPYTQAGASALGRAVDSQIYAAFNGDALTGVDGSTTTTFAADGGVTQTLTGGLTQAGVIAAKEQFYANDVDDDEEFFMVISSKQIGDLLAIPAVGSVDYNSLKPLVEGKIAKWMGFNFIHMSDSLMTVSGGVRTCFAWAKSGMMLSTGIDMEARITERADKGFSTYLYNAMSCGATRMQGKKVIQLQVTEA